MNWKRILIISLLTNLILLAAVWYKYSIRNHPSTKKINALVQSSLAMNSRAIESSVQYIRPTLDKKPKLRETIQEGIEKIREENSDVIDEINGLVMKIETIENDTGGIDLERRVLPYQLLTADGGLDSMDQFIARHLVFFRGDYFE
ncbi:MAG: hypothetical protein ACI94Y_002799 [Maribacter sp.]|jgi:hypothetical protein